MTWQNALKFHMFDHQNNMRKGVSTAICCPSQKLLRSLRDLFIFIIGKQERIFFSHPRRRRLFQRDTNRVTADAAVDSLEAINSTLITIAPLLSLLFTARSQSIQMTTK